MEEEKKEEIKEETEEQISPIVRAEELMKKLEEKEKLINERENLLAERLLAGTAGGGVPHQKMTEEELKKKAAVDYWKGTGIAKAIEDYKEDEN